VSLHVRAVISSSFSGNHDASIVTSKRKVTFSVIGQMPDDRSNSKLKDSGCDTVLPDHGYRMSQGGVVTDGLVRKSLQTPKKRGGDLLTGHFDHLNTHEESSRTDPQS
jgi:hypothetical protein